MAEESLLRDIKQDTYQMFLHEVGRDYPSAAFVFQTLIEALKVAVQDQYVEAQMLYDEMYGWSMDPEETFEEWLDHEYPQLADLPSWIFIREVEDGP